MNWLTGLTIAFLVLALGFSQMTIQTQKRHIETLQSNSRSTKEPTENSTTPSDQPVEWKHGWKTDRVIASRYTNEMMGYNIGFRYPKDPGNSDRKELDDFMRDHRGNVYQSGGYPGAEMFVVFDDVKDKESANRKLKEILPPLSKLVASF